MAEIKSYADALGIKPNTVVQNAGCGNGRTWQNWEKGSTCTLRIVGKIRDYMKRNPVPAQDHNNPNEEDAA